MVATGSYHAPRIPAFARRITRRVTQLHSHEYRNQAALPTARCSWSARARPGSSSPRLFAGGRRVYVSVGSAGRVPRRYRGRDLFSWLIDVIRQGPAQWGDVPDRGAVADGRRRFSAMPALTGRHGGHDTNLRQYALDGMTLAGRLAAADGELLTFADDLEAGLANADRFFDERFRPVIDRFIERAAIDAPPPEAGLGQRPPISPSGSRGWTCARPGSRR